MLLLFWNKGYGHQIWTTRSRRDNNQIKNNLKTTDYVIMVKAHDLHKMQ